MSFTLRAATPADAAALSVFAGENFPDAAPAVVPREAVEAFIAENLTEEVLGQAITSGVYTVNLVLDTEGQILAYSAIDTVQPQPIEVAGNAAYLSKFYVGADARGVGISGMLMGQLVEDAQSAGYDGIHLGTHQENYRAQAFYEKMGFIKVGIRTFELTTGVLGQDFIYHLPLSAV
ncbi:GNAT family N-acetyltransferase [Rothia sp. LK2492]|uniref:GNAT family N-acetyltransferase n=1 Tax=Rothia sp. LK2492 TaxID=3114370 RepID=UPI0034CFEF1C